MNDFYFINKTKHDRDKQIVQTYYRLGKETGKLEKPTIS
jgi:hypothetical protein